DVRWPQDMTLTLMTDTRTNTVPDVAPVLQVVDDTMTRAGLTQSNVHGYRTVRFSALRSGDALDLTSEQLTGSGVDAYDVMVLDTEGYADLTGEQVTLAPGEALAWTDGAAFGMGISHRIAVLLAGVTGVSFDGINPAVFHLFHNSHMVDPFVLIPIKKDKVTGIRRVGIVLPLSPFLKPGNPLGGA
ncbi:hypothetical protein LEA_10580, partial [human gut metagenome]